MDETKDTGRRVGRGYEERVEIWSRIAAARRTCRSCGGYGYFGWGEMAPRNCPVCPACQGTGRV